MTKSKGYRAKTRSLLRRPPRERGKTGLSKILYEYKKGEKAVVKIDPSVHKGMPHNRFQGHTGTVEGKQGESYLVGINDGKKHKTLIVRPDHLRRVR